MDELKDLTLEQMNWEICMANLDDAIKYLQECQENLEKALKNVDELRNMPISITQKTTICSGMVKQQEV